MRTSDIAKAVGTHSNTVRLYEEWGFLPPIPRSPSGYRLYTQAHLDQMQFARMALHGGWPGRNIRQSALALGLVFWSPGVLFTWVFDGVFQMARYPLGLYPSWLRLVLTWVVPVGVITTVPAQALTGAVSVEMLAGRAGLAAALLIGASALFRFGLRRYASASS